MITITVQLDEARLQAYAVDGIADYIKDSAMGILEDDDAIYDLIKEVTVAKAREIIPELVAAAFAQCRPTLIEQITERIMEA